MGAPEVPRMERAPRVRLSGNRPSVIEQIRDDAAEFSEEYDPAAPPVGVDLSGHDRALLGPKVVVVDAFVMDLLEVDTSAQTFRPKLLLNMDWEDDGVIEPETRAKRLMGGAAPGEEAAEGGAVYRTGKFCLRSEFHDDPLGTTWNPEMVLVNAMSDEEPIEAGSSFHAVQMLNGRPVISRSMLYQPECRCVFTFEDFPFDETDLVVKFNSNKWSAEEVEFIWSHRLKSTPKKVQDGGRRRMSLGGAGAVEQDGRYNLDANLFQNGRVFGNAQKIPGIPP